LPPAGKEQERAALLSDTTAGMVKSSSAWASRVETDGSLLMMALASMTREWTGLGGVAVAAAGAGGAWTGAGALEGVSMVGAGSWTDSGVGALGSAVGCSIVGTGRWSGINEGLQRQDSNE